jgi:hypothetical protein
MTLVDTSAWVEALRKNGRAEFKERVKALMQAQEAAACEMVLLELWNGVQGDEEKKSLAAIERHVKLLPLTSDVWKSAYELARQSRVRGLTIPATDLLVAACARCNGAELYHNDSHFSLLAAVPS